MLERQSGVLSRRQALAGGLQPHDLRRMVRRRELAPVHPGVYVDHTGPLTWVQRAWAGVLATEPSALSHRSALRAADGPGRREVDDAPIHVAVDRRRTVEPPPGVVRHYLGGLDQRVLWNASPPRVQGRARRPRPRCCCRHRLRRDRRARRRGPGSASPPPRRLRDALGRRERIARRGFLERCSTARGGRDLLGPRATGYLARRRARPRAAAGRAAGHGRQLVVRCLRDVDYARYGLRSSSTDGSSTTSPAPGTATWTAISTRRSTAG